MAKQRVGGDDRQVFKSRLRDQHAIEGIALRPGERARRNSVREIDGERLEAVAPRSAWQIAQQPRGVRFSIDVVSY